VVRRVIRQNASPPMSSTNMTHRAQSSGPNVAELIVTGDAPRWTRFDLK
jgi:hypothetical protein